MPRREPGPARPVRHGSIRIPGAAERAWMPSSICCALSVIGQSGATLLLAFDASQRVKSCPPPGCLCSRDAPGKRAAQTVLIPTVVGADAAAVRGLPEVRALYMVPPMEHWDLRSLDVTPHQPQILQSARGEGRAIALHLPAGESLNDHEVHERAYLTVVEGEVEVDGGETVAAGSGALFVFDPKERHEVRA